MSKWLHIGFLLAASLFSLWLSGQSISDLEDKLKDSHGILKLEVSNQLTSAYLESGDHRLQRQALLTVDFADQFFTLESRTIYPERLHLHSEAYRLLARAYIEDEKYSDAAMSVDQAIQLAGKYGLEDELALADALRSSLDDESFEQKNKKPLRERIKLGEKIKSGLSDVDYNSKVRMAEASVERGELLRAIDAYQRAIQILEDRGEHSKINEHQLVVAGLYHQMGNNKKALDQYELLLDRKTKLSDTSGIRSIIATLSELRPALGRQAPPVASTPMNEAQKDSVNKEKDYYGSLAQKLETGKDYKKSLEYYKLYTELNDRLKEEEQQQQLALLEKSYKIEKQGQALAILEADAEINELKLLQQEEQLSKEQTFRRTLAIGMVALLLGAILLLILYRSKRRALNELHDAYESLEQTQLKLISAEEKVKELLDQQVSHGVARQLLTSDNANQVQKKFVCIMFLDIRDFTPFAEKRQPVEIIDFQNKVFGFMIDIVDQYDGVINQFLGDGFMATFGLSETKGNVCCNAYQAARKILDRLSEANREGVIPDTRIGIGLHAGNVVAGNVGTEIRKQYSITGNTVILASRLEQLNKKFNSQLVLSEEVYVQLEPELQMARPNFKEEQVKGREKPVRVLAIGADLAVS